MGSGWCLAACTEKGLGDEYEDPGSPGSPECKQQASEIQPWTLWSCCHAHPPELRVRNSTTSCRGLRFGPKAAEAARHGRCMVSLHPAEAQNPARTAKPASEDRLCGWMSKAGMDATKGLFLADLERNIETFWAAVSAHGSTGMGHSAHMQEDCYKIGAVSLGLGPQHAQRSRGGSKQVIHQCCRGRNRSCSPA